MHFFQKKPPDRPLNETPEKSFSEIDRATRFEVIWAHAQVVALLLATFQSCKFSNMSDYIHSECRHLESCANQLLHCLIVELEVERWLRTSPLAGCVSLAIWWHDRMAPTIPTSASVESQGRLVERKHFCSSVVSTPRGLAEEWFNNDS